MNKYESLQWKFDYTKNFLYTVNNINKKATRRIPIQSTRAIHTWRGC